MAGDQNPEIAVEAIITILTASLPAQLDAIDTAMNDGITLDDIAHFYRAPLWAYDTLPACVVMAQRTVYPDLFRPDVIRQHVLELQVYLECHEASSTKLPQEILTARLERTMKGIHTVILANPTLDVSGTSKADHTLIQGVEYSNLVPRGDDGVFRGARMTLLSYFST